MLEQAEWGEYKLGDLFEIQSTLSFNKDKLVDGADYDYVTRTSLNQGILQTTGFVNEENLNDSGCWSLGLLQMDFFYRRKKRYAGQFVRKIIPKIKLSENTILYFSTILNSQKKILLSVLVRDVDKVFEGLKIQLPTKNGEIDFEFMDMFIKELESYHIKELESYHIKELESYLQVTGLKDYNLTEQEKIVLSDFENGNLEWREFKIGGDEGLFEISTGRDIIIGKTKEGNIPLISHQHENNGITKRISQLKDRRIFNFNDTLSLADRGLFGASCQNENFHIGTRVKALTFKDGEKSKEHRLFFVSSINMLQILFTDYSDNATDNLPNLKIQLPTKDNKPDYELMETFISAIQKLVIKDVVDYANEKIKAYHKVIG